MRLRIPLEGGKRCWQVPSHPLAQAWLRLLGEPVEAELLAGPECQPPEQLDCVLVWKDACLGLPFSEVDIATTPWRWIRSGAVERREFEWVARRPTILSGAALPTLTQTPQAKGTELTELRWQL